MCIQYIYYDVCIIHCVDSSMIIQISHIVLQKTWNTCAYPAIKSYMNDCLAHLIQPQSSGCGNFVTMPHSFSSWISISTYQGFHIVSKVPEVLEMFRNKPEILSAFKREPKASILKSYKKLLYKKCIKTMNAKKG